MSDSCLKLEEANCADHCNRFRYRIFIRKKLSSEWGNATSILIKKCKCKLPEYSKSSDAYVIWSLLETLYSYVASLISDSGFLFVFVHICFSRNRLLHCIALSRKLSWNRRRVYFDAIILASTLLLDFLEETLIVEKPFKKDIFLMASCLVYIGRFLFFVLAGLQAYSLVLYLAKYK